MRRDPPATIWSISSSKEWDRETCDKFDGAMGKSRWIELARDVSKLARLTTGFLQARACSKPPEHDETLPSNRDAPRGDEIKVELCRPEQVRNVEHT
jgi:hypothetical protein